MRNRENPFCCGAGGGLLFEEHESGKRISQERFDQLHATGAPTMVVACPFCSIMLKGAAASSNTDVQTTDLMSFVDARMKAQAAQGGPGAGDGDGLVTAEPGWKASRAKRWQAVAIAAAATPIIRLLALHLAVPRRGRGSTSMRSTAARTPFIVAFWHGRILPGMMYFRDRGIVVITSENFDGEWIARIIRRFGFGTARGSSSRGAVKALVQLKREMEAGKSTAFTLDGPRGPAARGPARRRLAGPRHRARHSPVSTSRPTGAGRSAAGTAPRSRSRSPRSRCASARLSAWRRMRTCRARWRSWSGRWRRWRRARRRCATGETALGDRAGGGGSRQAGGKRPTANGQRLTANGLNAPADADYSGPRQTRRPGRHRQLRGPLVACAPGFRTAGT